MSIKLEHINYIYGEGTAYRKQALKDVSLEIPHGQFVGIIGHTGSGKSTLIQHLNGLIKATDGTFYFNGEDVYADGYSMRNLRSEVGLVFQYPEHQLFEVDVLTDVCFGPKIRGFQRKSARNVQKRLWKRWDFRKNIMGSRLLICREDRKEEWQSRVFWRCVRKCLFWTSQLRGLIRKVEMKF